MALVQHHIYILDKLPKTMRLSMLRDLGLSDGEIKIYGALLDIGQSPLNRIHEKTGIERRNIYDILNKLIERGLVSYVTENRRRLFQLANPTKLVGYVDEKMLDLERTKKEVQAMVPEITKKFNAEKPEIDAELFTSEDGVKAVWEACLEHKKIYFIAAGRYWPINKPHYFASWMRRRLAKKIPLHILLRQENIKDFKPFPMEKARFLPKAFSGHPNVIFVYGDNVANVMLHDQPFAFVIRNKQIAENYIKYFDFLWKQSTEP